METSMCEFSLSRHETHATYKRLSSEHILVRTRMHEEGTEGIQLKLSNNALNCLGPWWLMVAPNVVR